MLDEQAGQVFAMTDVIAERARKVGGTTLHHPIGDITRYQRIEDNSETMVSPPQPAVSLKIRGGIPPCPKSSARCTAIFMGLRLIALVIVISGLIYIAGSANRLK